MSKTVEGKLQTKIIKWLKDRGAYVIKVRAAPGVPVGCPDIIFLFGSEWGAVEVKASPEAKYQPGQLQTLRWLGDMNNGNVFVANPENWEDTKLQLETIFA